MADTMLDIKMRWDAKYGRLEVGERAALIKRECDAGRERLRAAGVVATMSADELMALTRGDE